MTRKTSIKKEDSNKKKQQQEVTSEEDDDEEVEDLPTQHKTGKDKNQRVSVSAEAYGNYNKKGNFKARVIPKNDDQKRRIRERLQKALDEKETEIVINAMEEKCFK